MSTKLCPDLYDNSLGKPLLISFFHVKGVLDNAGFPAVVTAHFVPVDGQQRPRTTILIKFAEEVVAMYLDSIILFL